MLFGAAFSVSAQAPAPPQPAAAPIKGETVNLVVLGTATPVPLAESTRSVDVIPLEPMQLIAESPQDAIRHDASVFLEERGTGGGQTDIVMQGGSFAQTLVLVNGFRINDAQTAHHNLDLPVPMEAMDQIQVLSGAGSTLHGIDALAGVVDLLTAAPQHNSLRLRLGEGSFQANEESLLGALVRKQWSARATADRNFSLGFIADRDYRNEDGSAESWYASRLGMSDLLFATSDRSFGAAGFYGNYPSWERTKSFFVGIRQDMGAQTNAAFAYRRHTDEFILFRSAPAIYENNHIDGSWQASLRHTVTVAKTSALLAGLEADGDSIHSNNLGIHARNQGAGYADLDLRPAARSFSVSVGAREEIFSGGRAVFSPQLAASYRLRPGLKLRAAGGYGFRIPTYTDLYYSDPATVGNANLKPESAWSGSAGIDYAGSRLTFSAGGFYSRQLDTIDYVRSATFPNPWLPPSCHAANTWCANNLNGLSFTGAETSLQWNPSRSQSIRLAWTGISGGQEALHGLQSEYVSNYPVNNAQAGWTLQLPRSITIENQLQVANRYQSTPYPVWNLNAGREAGRLRPYIRLSNLSNTGYQEIAGVPMPSRTIMGGFVFQFGD